MGAECCSNANMGKGQGAGAPGSSGSEQEVLSRSDVLGIDLKKAKERPTDQPRATHVPYFMPSQSSDKMRRLPGSLRKTAPITSNEVPLVSNQVAGMSASEQPRIVHVHDVRMFLGDGQQTRKLAFQNDQEPKLPAPSARPRPSGKVHMASPRLQLQEDVKGPMHADIGMDIGDPQMFTFRKRPATALKSHVRRALDRSQELVGASDSLVDPTYLYVQYSVIEKVCIDTFGLAWKVKDCHSNTLHTLTSFKKSAYQLREDWPDLLRVLQSLV